MKESGKGCVDFKPLFFCKDDMECEECLETDPLLNNESIIGCRVSDFCWYKKCLGFTVNTHSEAAGAEIADFKIKKISVMEKRPHQYKKGYWDIHLRYTFEFMIRTTDSDGLALNEKKHKRTHSQRVTLNGLRCPGYTIGTDAPTGRKGTFKSQPQLWVRAKAVPLNQRLCLKEYTHRSKLTVYVGLVSEVSLFRFSDMVIQAEGICVS
jgi:hypothetical protein